MQGGFVWDWAEANLRQPLVVTPDSSPNKIQAFLVGKPGQAPGHRGQAVDLSGLDDFVNVFRDRRLDLTGNITLDAWVRPGPWGGSFPIVTKGWGYALQMSNENALDSGHAGGFARVGGPCRPLVRIVAPGHRRVRRRGAAPLHRRQAGRLRRPGGPVDPGVYDVNVGRNAEMHKDLTGTRLGRVLVDDVRVYAEALPAAALAAEQDPASRAVLALDFDRFDRHGDSSAWGEPVRHRRAGRIGPEPPPETAERVGTRAVRSRGGAVAGVVRVHNEQQAARWTCGCAGRW